MTKDNMSNTFKQQGMYFSVCAEKVCCIIRLSVQLHFKLETNSALRALLKPARVGKGKEAILPHSLFIPSY